MATNVLTYLGEEWVVDRLVGSGGYSYSGHWVGWGTSTNTASSLKSETGLRAESTDTGSGARQSGTPAKSGAGSAAVWQNQATLTSNITQTITEAGCFSTNTAGHMFIKGDFTGIALSANDSIQFTFTLNPA